MSTIPGFLQDDLRAAMAVELTTIPAYLYAYWSIKPLNEGGSQAGLEAARTIMSVVDEEMLHMASVSNILNALGGTPAITVPPYLPQYPGPLMSHATNPVPDSTMVYLYSLSLDALNLFMAIELPEWGDSGDPTKRDWKTIAQFYEGIKYELNHTEGLTFEHGRQLPVWDNPGVGTLYPVASLGDALDGLNLVIEQGEGLKKGKQDDGEHELAHYWKFQEILANVEAGILDLDRDTYKLLPNPNANRYTRDQQHANLVFNSTYSDLLDALQAAFSSDSPDIFFPTGTYDAPTNYMEQLGRLAAVLRNQGNVPGTGCLPGPTFDYIAKDQRIYQ